MNVRLPKIIGLVLVLAAMGLLSSGGYKAYLAVQLYQNGVRVSGTVDRLWKNRGGPGRSDDYMAAVLFADEGGDAHEAELRLGEPFYRSLKRGDAIELKYPYGRPATAGLAGAVEAAALRAALIPLVGGAVFLLLAVFLFLRRS